jgi:transcription elongation factor Elf1
VLDIADKCPKCGKFQVPKIPPESKATAAACQSCGFVVERKVEKNA